MKSRTMILYPNQVVADRVAAYSEEVSLKLPDHIPRYHDEVEESSGKRAMYMISNFQAQASIFLACLSGAKRVLEVGVFVGYSCLAWAHAVGPDGVVTGLEFNPEYAQKAREAFKRFGVENVDIIEGDAVEALETMTPVEPYDLIFLDAQKSGYPTYLSTILSRSQPGSTNRLLRPGGLIIADNALSRGLVADPSDDNPWAAVQRAEWESAADPAATSQGDVAPARFAGNGVVGYGKSEFARSDDIARLDEFNRAMAASERLESLMLPVWDGLALARMVD